MHAYPYFYKTRGFWDLQMLRIQQPGPGAVFCQTHCEFLEHGTWILEDEESEPSGFVFKEMGIIEISLELNL